MKMVEGSKQVRVDNWGVFFLQRLQTFFSKTDYCDLTLQFEGNVQLKVHRLVMNACTEYFTILEQNCPASEENTIMMPGDLQSDIIVPIVNFMYTGMLEFHMSLFEKLYSAAELMNITILTKLLDAQRNAYQQHRLKHKSETKSKSEVSWMKKPLQKEKAPPFSNDLQTPSPGRKVPVWKRKAASTPLPHPVSQLHFPENRYPMDPLSIPDNTPKPTRFEWPEEDLPALSFMDNSFQDVSLTSKPLLTKEDEDKAKPSFDDLRYNIEVPKKKSGNLKASSSSVNTAEVEEFVKEQKIRSAMFEDAESYEGVGQKRKLEQTPSKQLPKKVKANNKENQETTISVEGNELTDMANIDHTKIVAEILKKYPDLVKKNKNIKLKIMTSGKSSPDKATTHAVVEKTKKSTVQVQSESSKSKSQISAASKRFPRKKDAQEEGPWVCRKCIAIGVEPQEFVLYYLYRKHMTDVHNEVFDSKLCKYCGKQCATDNLMMYHLYTKHGLKPPSSYNFPKCNRCPFIAQSSSRLDQHKQMHKPNEMQCQDCKLAFSNSNSLSAHVRVTGHYNKPGKTSFDCQYCMKKLQSAINLFAHIKNTHPREGKRDGIVCLDELETMEDLDEEEAVKDVYAVPETVPGLSTQKEKVKIISNVKVPASREKAESARVIQLDPSSEAESLNNVASGIATSLGLVDIVVLDENQQYILQQDGQEEQEFIIPDLGTGQSFARQVITTQHNAVIQQSMIQSTGSEIGSTDELVMVLTDHEYADDHDGGDHSDNSNIVVLYSHPVEGQEGQFITSQGNLLVNSQTGMLEIRNGTGMGGSSSDQVLVANDDDAPVESIEMIHREIHGTSANMKGEPYYEEDNKSVVPYERDVVPVSQGEAEENQSEETQEPQGENSTEHSENKDNDVQETEKGTEDDAIDGNEDTEEPMEIEEIEEGDVAENSQTNDQMYTVEEPSEEQIVAQPPAPENTVDDNVCGKEVDAIQEEEGLDVPPEKAVEQSSEDSGVVTINDPKIIVSCDDSFITESSVEMMEIDGETAEKQGVEEKGDGGETGGIVEEQTEEAVPEEAQLKVEEAPVEPQQEPEETQTKIEDASAELQETLADVKDVPAELKEAEEPRAEPEETTEAEPEKLVENQDQVVNEGDGEAVGNKDSCDTFEENVDEDKAVEAGGVEKQDERKSKHSDINKTILDDWEEEDTDSQQSEKQAQEESEEVKDEDENQTRAAENVNKLMDDWEEEDEEEKKETE